MTAEERCFLVLLVINLILVVLYLLFCLLLKIFWKRERVRSVLPKAAVMLLCPVVGFGFVTLGYLCHKVVFWRAVSLDDVVFSKERVKPQLPAEEERESNVAPVEEAVSVADQDSLRSMVMHVVQGDVKRSAAAIAAALNSDDTEASHYAAAALQGVLNEFYSTVQKNTRRIEQRKEDGTRQGAEERLRLAEETADFMAEFMRWKLLTDREQKQYAGVMDELCELLFQDARERLTVERFAAAAMQQLEAGDYECCRKWCLRLYARHPEALEAYTCQLKLYLTAREKEKFFRVLEELCASGIAVDQETLELIRVFV